MVDHVRQTVGRVRANATFRWHVMLDELLSPNYPEVRTLHELSGLAARFRLRSEPFMDYPGGRATG